MTTLKRLCAVTSTRSKIFLDDSTAPDRWGPRHIREYQAELFHKRKLSAGSVAVRLAALRFFYTKTLRRVWSVSDTPYPKKDHRLPAMLSQEEVAQLIQAAGTFFHRTVLMTLYATGARNAEFTRLKFLKNFVSTGTAYAENQESGSFRATTTIAPITRSIRKPFGIQKGIHPHTLRHYSASRTITE